jgi:glutamyl/glutaminyl-tRNA synthetase
VQDLRKTGYLREAVINYLSLLGWGYDESTTFFTIEQLQELFSLERVSKNPAVFDEQKLRWMNGRYLRELSVDDLTARLEEFTGREGLRGAVEITQEKISTLDEFWGLAGSFFDGPVDDPKAREKFLEPRESREALEDVRAALADLPEPWTVENVEETLRGVAERTGRKAKQIFQPLRVASPGIFETVALLGRAETLARLGHALEA